MTYDERMKETTDRFLQDIDKSKNNYDLLRDEKHDLEIEYNEKVLSLYYVISQLFQLVVLLLISYEDYLDICDLLGHPAISLYVSIQIKQANEEHQYRIQEMEAANQAQIMELVDSYQQLVKSRYIY